MYSLTHRRTTHTKCNQNLAVFLHPLHTHTHAHTHTHRFNRNTGLLEMSRTTFVVTDLPPLGQTVFKLLKLFRLIDVKQEEGAEGMVSINNLTIINFVLKLRGPTHERTLTNYILLIQVAVWGIAQVFIHYTVAF